MKKRISFCCDDCRQRLTPASVRFLGRKVYLGAVVLLACASGKARRRGASPGYTISWASVRARWRAGITGGGAPSSARPSERPHDRALRVRLTKVPEDASGFLFPRYRVAKTARDRRGGVRQMLACGRAGLPFGRRQGGITFHWATRRAGATRLIRDRRNSLKTVQQIGGWKRPEVMLDIYAETNDEALLAAVRPPELVKSGAAAAR